MYIYTAVVSSVIAVSSCVMMYLFHKNKFLNLSVVFVITIGSLLTSISFPKAINIFIDVYGNYGIGFAVFSCVVVYSALLMLFTTLAGMLVEGSKLNNVFKAAVKSSFLTKIREELGWDKEDSAVNLVEATDVLKAQTLLDLMQGKNILEKPVDSEKNIGTMGLETIITESIPSGISTGEYTNQYIGDNCKQSSGSSDSHSQDNEIKHNDPLDIKNETDNIDVYEAIQDYYEDEPSNVISTSEIEQDKALQEVFVVPDSKEVSKSIEFAENEKISDSIECIESQEVSKPQTVIEDKEIKDENDSLKTEEALVDNVTNHELYGNDNDLNKIYNSEQNIIEPVCSIDNEQPVLDMVSTSIEEVGASEDIIIELFEDVFGNNDDKTNEPDAPTEIIEDKKMGLLDCIDEAFKLKEAGDREGAILNYLYALDQQPDDDMVFWLILDICVLYKELGQVELAKDILEGYVDKYGHVMEEAVRIEIEKNLL